MEESHKCKLCSRGFANGRALGGHMKAHLAVLPLPPPKREEALAGLSLSLSAASSSSSSSAEELEFPPEESEEKAVVYELRENPKKSFRFADPVFTFAHHHHHHHHHVASDIVVQDRESETESRNPTRKRSKRNRKPDAAAARAPRRKLESFDTPISGKPTATTVVDSPPEPEPASSVSDTSPEEDVAMCLMMLSRDRWVEKESQKQDQKPNTQKEARSFGEFEELRSNIKPKKLIRRKKKCEKCTKQFRSFRALFSHEKVCRLQPELEEEEEENMKNGGNRRVFKCPFCFKLFGSGQALGGHKRSHLVSSATAAVNASDSHSLKLEISLIDLNLPAPVEEDDYSVVSDA